MLALIHDPDANRRTRSDFYCSRSLRWLTWAAGFTKKPRGCLEPTPPGPDAGTLTISGPGGNAPIPEVMSASGGSSGVYSTPASAASYIPATGGGFTFKLDQ